MSLTTPLGYLVIHIQRTINHFTSKTHLSSYNAVPLPPLFVRTISLRPSSSNTRILLVLTIREIESRCLAAVESIGAGVELDVATPLHGGGLVFDEGVAVDLERSRRITGVCDRVGLRCHRGSRKRGPWCCPRVWFEREYRRRWYWLSGCRVSYWLAGCR